MCNCYQTLKWNNPLESKPSIWMSNPNSIITIVTFFGAAKDLPGLENEKQFLKKHYEANKQFGSSRIEYKHVDKNGHYSGLRRIINNYKDSVVIIQISGHGTGDSIQVNEKDDAKLEASELALILKDCPHLKLLILNYCGDDNYFETMQEIFERTSAPAIIATKHLVYDKAAINFCKHFHQNLVNGRSIVDAFNLTKIDLVQEVKSTTETEIGLLEKQDFHLAQFGGLKSLILAQPQKKNTYTLFVNPRDGSILNWKLENGISMPAPLTVQQKLERQNKKIISLDITKIQHHFLKLNKVIANKRAQDILQETMQKLKMSNSEDVFSQVNSIIYELQKEYQRIDKEFSLENLSLEQALIAYEEVKNGLQQTSFGVFSRRQDQGIGLLSNLRIETLFNKIKEIQTPAHQKNIGELIFALLDAKHELVSYIIDPTVTQVDVKFFFDLSEINEVESEKEQISFPVELLGGKISGLKNQFHFLSANANVILSRTFAKRKKGIRPLFVPTEIIKIRIIDATLNHNLFEKFSQLDKLLEKDLLSNNSTCTFKVALTSGELQFEVKKCHEIETEWLNCADRFEPGDDPPHIVHIISDQAEMDEGEPCLKSRGLSKLVFNSDSMSPIIAKILHNDRSPIPKNHSSSIEKTPKEKPPHLFIVQEWGNNMTLEIFELITARLANGKIPRVCFIPHVSSNTSLEMNSSNLIRELYKPLLTEKTFGAIIQEIRLTMVEKKCFALPVLYLNESDLVFGEEPPTLAPYSEQRKVDIKTEVTSGGTD